MYFEDSKAACTQTGPWDTMQQHIVSVDPPTPFSKKRRGSGKEAKVDLG